MGNGDVIRQRRRDMKMTQASLAIASGLSLRTVQRIENGRDCQFESIQAVSSVLGIQPASTGATAAEGRILADHAREAARIGRIAGRWQAPATAAIAAAAGTLPAFAVARIRNLPDRWPEWADATFVAWIAISYLPVAIIAVACYVRIHGSARLASIAACASGAAALVATVRALAYGQPDVGLLVAAAAQAACSAVAMAAIAKGRTPREAAWIEPTLDGRRELQRWMFRSASVTIGFSALTIASATTDKVQVLMPAVAVFFSGLLQIGAAATRGSSQNDMRVAVLATLAGMAPLLASILAASVLPDSSLEILKGGIIAGAVITQSPRIADAIRQTAGSGR